MVSSTSHTSLSWYTCGKCIYKIYIIYKYTSLEYCTDGHKKRGGSNVGGIAGGAIVATIAVIAIISIVVVVVWVLR